MEVYAIMCETDDGELEYILEEAFSTFKGAEVYLESKDFTPDVAHWYANKSRDTFARIVTLNVQTAIETKDGVVFIEKESETLNV